MAQPPPIKGSDSHGREANNIKFLIVEDVQPTGRPERRKAYFHQQIVHENHPLWNQIEHQHWALPMAYENANSWEWNMNYTIRLPRRLPEHVQKRYAESFPMVQRIPVMRIGIFEEQIPGIQIEDDKRWLRKYLGVEILHCLFTGKTGMYFCGKVFPAPQSYYSNDLSRLDTAFDMIVCVKMYITHQMTRQDQMDRLYEETLAHCELKHPNIVDTYSVRYRVRQAHPNAQGVINAIDGITDLHSFIIMEYSELGSMSMLLQKIVNENLGFDYYHLYLHDIISGLLYLHSTGRAHRELNQTNFLAVQAQRGFNFKEDELDIEDPTAANCVIKICDFAFTKKSTQPIFWRDWQSMDVMDMGRNILWHCFNYIRKVQGNQQLLNELCEMVKFLTDDDSKKRLDNLQSLKMKEGVDDGKNVRAFMNKVVAGRSKA